MAEREVLVDGTCGPVYVDEVYDVYEGILERIQVHVDAIPGASLGYIGNCGPGYDDRLWCVFLAHPGRVGTPDDRLGGWATGDEDGARKALVLVAAFRRGVEYAGRL